MYAQGRRLLLADADPDVQETVAILAEGLGYELTGAMTGAEAVRLAASLLPDLVVLDTVLPDGAGYQILVQLKADPRTAAIPVVIWSGGREEQPSDRAVALEAGAVDYMDMVNAHLLLRRLERLLSRLAPTPPRR